MKLLNFKKGGFEMKTRNISRHLVLAAVTVMATSLTGCFKMGSLTSGGSNGSSSSGASVSVPTGGAEGPVAGVLKSDQVFPSLKAMTGVTNPSGTTVTTFNNNKSNLSIYGNPQTDVGQPLLQAHMTIAAEFCNDAITQNPNLFPGINFTGASTQFSGATLTSVVNTMANNFWRRAPTAAEMTLITNAVPGFTTDATTGQTAAAVTKTVAISLCASMLGTTSAVAN